MSTSSNSSSTENLLLSGSFCCPGWRADRLPPRKLPAVVDHGSASRGVEQLTSVRFGLAPSRGQGSSSWTAAAAAVKTLLSIPVFIACVDASMESSRTSSSLIWYDPNTNEWSSEVASLSSPRSGVCVVEMDGYMYALGGHDGTVCTSTVERYDPEISSWTKLTPMRQPRSGAAAAVLDGYLYVIGGTDGDMALCSVERFNPLDGTWQTCASMGTPRERAGCAVYLGCLYVAGGRDELMLELSTVEKFDPHTLHWTPVPRMRNKRHQASLLVFGERLLAVGGWDGTSNLRTIETYNPDANGWRHFGSVKVSHPGGQCVLVKTTQKDVL